MDPLRELEENSREVNSMSEPIEEGIDPTKRLLCRNNIDNLVKLPTSEGIDPVRELDPILR
jgi:hypothetical protein